MMNTPKPIPKPQSNPGQNKPPIQAPGKPKK
jgi:hypothetical protein